MWPDILNMLLSLSLSVQVMDYVQEDLDAMQQELDKWRSENAQHALDLKREMKWVAMF